MFVLSDWIFFAVCCLFTAYIFFFSLLSLRKRKTRYPQATVPNHFVVLFPAYKEDAVILESIRNFFNQTYSHYDVLVISDGMKQQTNSQLQAMGAEVLIAQFEVSSKAAALNLAMKHLHTTEYDVVVVLDADNHVSSDFLEKLNDVFNSGVKAVQAHRVAKNKNTHVALLDAASEEINHSVFRRGHIQVGLSAALSGSGMAFDFDWFRKRIQQVKTVGEDKELELLLLQDKIFVDYLDNVHVWDEKIQQTTAFSRQRQRWLFAQYSLLWKGLKYLPQAVWQGNLGYCDKLFQWIMPPRIVLLGIIPCFGLISWSIDSDAVWKWFCLYFIFLMSLILALPRRFYTKSLVKAITVVPLLFLNMLLNMFRSHSKNNKEFIHTQHGKENENSN